jgi:hopanoid biosynthesis associated RND transporter like protein HpnN
MSLALATHLTEGFLGLDAPAAQGEQKAPLSLSFLNSLLEQMEQTLAASLSYHSVWGNFFGNEKLTSDGFLVSDDKRFVFLLVDPQKRGEGLNPRQESIATIRHHIADVRTAFPRVQAGVTGDEALWNDEMLAAQADSPLATVISLVGVGILYLLFFRHLQRTLILVATMSVGLSWTLGLLTLTVGHLSLISIFVAPILIGLADDQAISFLSRYEEERDLGRSFSEAIHRTFTQAAPGLIAAACTNALAFYAMTLADFRGVQELGFIVGNGMWLSLLVTLTFLPAMLTLTEGHKSWQKSMRRGTRLAREFARWGQAVQHVRRPVLLLTVGVSLLCLLALPTLTFDYNLLHLQAHGTESVSWELRILENSGRSSWFALATASSVAEVAQKAAQFAALPAVEKVQTIASLVPVGQEERQRLIQELAALIHELPVTGSPPSAVDREQLKQTLEQMKFKLQEQPAGRDTPQQPPEREMLSAVRGRLDSVLSHLNPSSEKEAAALERLQTALFQDFAAQWALLHQNLAPSGPITLADIPAQVRSRFVSADGTKFLLQIYPRQDIWERAPLEEFVRQLRQVDSNVTGFPVMSYESIPAIKNGYLEGGLYATVAISIVAFFTLREWRATLLAMLPAGCGMLWLVGLMWLGHLTFNLANLVAVPITIGIGVESGIYLVRRAREEGRAGWVLVEGSTGQSVALFSLSTMVGFGSLMVARHSGIFSMGLLLTVAVGSVLLVSLTVLPLLLQPPPSGRREIKSAFASGGRSATESESQPRGGG